MRRPRANSFLKLSITLIKIKCYIYHKVELTRDIGVLLLCQKGVSGNVIHQLCVGLGMYLGQGLNPVLVIFIFLVFNYTNS